MNNKAQQIFTIRSPQLDKIEALAEKDYQFWEKKAARKERQCYNTYEGCRRGIIGEYVAGLYAKSCLETQGNTSSTVRWLGIEERKDGVSFKRGFKDAGDILLMNKGEDTYHTSIEVKTIDSSHPYGQVLPYHINKYIRNRIDYVVFVVVEDKWDSIKEERYVEAVVYQSKRPQEIKTWNMKDNWFGQPCFTDPNFE